MASGLPSTLSSNDSSVIKPPVHTRALLRATDRILAHERRTGKLPRIVITGGRFGQQVCEQRQTPAAGICCRAWLTSCRQLGRLPVLTSPLGSCDRRSSACRIRQPSVTSLLWDAGGPLMLSKPTPRRNGSLSPWSCLWKLNEECSLTFSKCQKHQNQQNKKPCVLSQWCN